MQTESKSQPLKEAIQNLANKLRLIIDVAETYYKTHGFSCDTIGLCRTKELLTGLDLSVDPGLLTPLLVVFENTMMGYENNVLGLEEKGLLPDNFASETFMLVQKLRFSHSGSGIQGQGANT